ncbi:diguanylate cyclase (GGDEF) domain-containing protein [Ruminococcus flavefaciens]|uniref:Diguanylate cyclase (GGDEF) domain-containing protein n=1 Tax=Ruminococcus flavefaciens TaxID=1265 RepID=A0A1H6IEG0_RUMFL|nr:GGDEF domain-containing protein [Ruminococcus flavefaciens]SEH45309.1 diguanylate cyclase (GGDEF) domain-containing protein [Ruminococcus flavefaciens]
MNSELIGEELYSVGRVVVDKSLHTQSGDEAFFTFFGNDVTYSIRRTIDDDDFPRLMECIEKVSVGEVRRTVIRMKGINGEYRWILAAVRLFGAGEAEPLYSITFSDVLSLESLAYSRESKSAEYRNVLSLISDLAFEYSFETKRIRIYMFECFREIVLLDEELEKWRSDAIEAGYILTRYIETFNALCRDIRNGVYRFDHELETSMFTEGKTRETCLFRGITRYDMPDAKKVSGIISVVNSRSKTKDINLALEANKDSLSSLLNKRAVTSFAQEILAEKPSYTVDLVILDIDNFTDINNGYGHLFGDEVIYKVASIIRSAIGSRGIAGRISGSGFLIVLENTRDEEDLRGILRAIRTNTEFAFADRSEKIHLTCSMGVAAYPVDSESYDELFMQADKALYIAKEKGQNRYVIYDINKHGPVEKDMENKIAFLSGKGEASEKLGFVSGLAENLVLGRIPDISVLLEQVRSQFGIDDICVFSGSDMGLMLSCGNAPSKNASYLLENNYTDRFSGDGIFVIDNVNELEGRDDNAFAKLTEQNIGGAVQYLMTEESMIKGMISFCYIGRFKKWSVADINYFAVIGRTISALLKKQAYI